MPRKRRWDSTTNLGADVSTQAADEKGNEANTTSQQRPVWLMVGLFILTVIILQWAWAQARGAAIERAVIDSATVGSAVLLINAITPEVQARAVGSRIKAPGGGINVLNGCEGTEVLFLFAAAMLAYPFSWRTRLTGLLTGTALIFVANQARLLALFYSYQSDRALFNQLHGLVMPLALIALTLTLLACLIYLDDRHGQPLQPKQQA